MSIDPKYELRNLIYEGLCKLLDTLKSEGRTPQEWVLSAGMESLIRDLWGLQSEIVRIGHKFPTSHAASLLDVPFTVSRAPLWLDLIPKEYDVLVRKYRMDIIYFPYTGEYHRQLTWVHHNGKLERLSEKEKTMPPVPTEQHDQPLPLGTFATLQPGIRNPIRVRIEGYRVNAEGISYQVNTPDGKFDLRHAWFKLSDFSDIELSKK